MKVYNPPSLKIPADLYQLLMKMRHDRNFQADQWVQQKIQLINDYFATSHLRAAVVGLSGGLDSSLAVALIHQAMQVENSTIEKLVCVFTPVFDSQAATGQDEARARAQEVCKRYGLKLFELDLTPAHSQIASSLADILDIASSPWSSGQLVSYLRTPVLYYATSLLTDHGYPALVVGTTNRDEGAYLGYVGKAADGMVDLQIISDLHKSEVMSASAYLGVPQSVLDTVPTGDMYDGRPDEEVFGAPYDFVELYLGYLCLDDGQKQKLMNDLCAPTKLIFDQLASNLEKLHNYNKHKYSVGSPSVHLDIYPSHVPGGWQ